LFHDNWLLPASAAIFHGLNQRLPHRRMRRTVCTFHDLFVMTGEYSTPEFRARFTEQARHAAAHADRIITVSRFTADQVHTLLGYPRERIAVVHHGVRPPAVRSTTPRERIVLHVGALQKRKNISRLVAAFESMPADWRLVLAGSAGYGAHEILKHIERSPACARIQVTGFVTNEVLEDLYSRASIFAFPSLDEGFGMPLLDAMAREVPVLTSNRSAMPEVVGDAALMVNAENPAEIAHGLNRIAAEAGFRDELVERGLLRAAKFPWTAAIQKTWAVYQDLLSA
jgi:glycosyltransferase involved in cell wall biosynthesis